MLKVVENAVWAGPGDMERELADMLGRDVDIVTRKSLEQSRNYIRRKHILEHLETLYAA